MILSFFCKIPENDEFFTIELIGVSGGSSIDPSVDGPTVQGGTAQVVIRTNDAPLRFASVRIKFTVKMYATYKFDLK